MLNCGQYTITQKFKSFVAAGLACGFVALGSATAQDWSAVEIKSSDLGHGLYMLTGRGGNLGASIGADGIFLIDDQYAPLTDKISAALKRLAKSSGSGDVKYVLNTHWHGDHTGGNEALGTSGSVIVAHRNVRKRMSTQQVSKLRNRTTPPSPKDAWPVVTFDSNVDFYFNGHHIEVKAVAPAHTDGDAIVYFADANVLHMGDTFFNNMLPFIDTESGGRIEGMIDAHNEALLLVDAKTKIIPGHGPLATRKDLVVTRDKLMSIRDALQGRIDKGMSDADIIADKPLDSLDLGWEGFLTHEQFVAIVLNGMRK